MRAIAWLRKEGRSDDAIRRDLTVDFEQLTLLKMELDKNPGQYPIEEATMSEEKIIPVPGHTQVDEHGRDLIGLVREEGKKLEALLHAVRHHPDVDADPRWISIAQTHLQQGLMALVRSIAKPDFF